jgi:DNA-binding MarR family transcriptional regulator
VTRQPHNEIDDVIHQKTRLAIMASLAGVKRMDFNELKAQLALTDGNLSTHLSHLENARYVNINKTFKGKKPRTTVAISAKGRRALNQYLDALKALIDQAEP